MNYTTPDIEVITVRNDLFANASGPAMGDETD